MDRADGRRMGQLVVVAIVSFALALVGLAGWNPVQNPTVTVGRWADCMPDCRRCRVTQ